MWCEWAKCVWSALSQPVSSSRSRRCSRSSASCRSCRTLSSSCACRARCLPGLSGSVMTSLKLLSNWRLLVARGEVLAMPSARILESSAILTALPGLILLLPGPGRENTPELPDLGRENEGGRRGGAGVDIANASEGDAVSGGVLSRSAARIDGLISCADSLEARTLGGDGPRPTNWPLCPDKLDPGRL